MTVRSTRARSRSSPGGSGRGAAALTGARPRRSTACSCRLDPPRLPTLTGIAGVAKSTAAAGAGVLEGNFVPVITAQISLNGDNSAVLLSLLPADGEEDGCPLPGPHGYRSHDRNCRD